MARDTYSNIKYPDFNAETLEAIKETRATLLALEYSVARNEPEPNDPIAYLEQWLTFDYEARCWRPDPSKL